MDSSFYSYGLMVMVCTMILANDLRKRVISKDTILYRIKDKRKTKTLFYILGLFIPVLILITGLTLDYDLPVRLLVVVMSIEMAVLWTMIQLSDGLVTNTHAGKVWFTRFDQVVFYQVLEMKGNQYFLFKKHNAKRQEMLLVNKEDVEPIKKILNTLGLRTYSEYVDN
ncbi:MAG TPA: hypothetical protein VLS94_07460 [Fusibacter sp.]|nr:hypothetical protein [Fusibacter sp.]